MEGSKKSLDVQVSCFDKDFTFAIPPSATGQQLFDEVCKALGLREVWYFGLHYVDSKGFLAWVKMEKKLLQQDVKHCGFRFTFQVAFYPEGIEEEIIQEITLRYFYMQVKELIISGRIYCPSDKCIVLASHIVQAKLGDFNIHNHRPGFLKEDKLLPECVISQFKLDDHQWEEEIMSWWAEHRTTPREAAMLSYLKVAQELDMYGIEYFEISNKKGTDLFLGVQAGGISIYKKNNKLIPENHFIWAEIANLSFSGKKFIVKFKDKSAKKLIFYSSHIRINKTILSLCVGNNTLYYRRRQPATPEVMQLKEQATEERNKRRLEAERLQQEINAREMAEEKQRECEMRLQQLQKEMESTLQELASSRNTISDLKQLVSELEKNKRALEKEKEDVSKLTLEMDSMRLTTIEDRDELDNKIASYESMLAEMRTRMYQKEDESSRLQQQLEDIQSRIFNETVNSSSDANSSDRTFDLQSRKDDFCSMKEMTCSPRLIDTLEIDRQNLAHVKDHENMTDLDTRDGDANLSDRTFDLQSQKDDFCSMQEINWTSRLIDKLETTKQNLAQKRDREKMTDLDIASEENNISGRDKCTTLQQIRGGITKRRVEQFENL
ncbi:ezrin/radixin/moesin family domain-containing protein [Ditylenchus destructor]|uniref:Ezrin/radixin/moesin family domain-containing protein n=1 Tax=Ditylenchus destructor TaxID=166010 RepID=A0AAD4N3J6_9BILA|nr:ezrin/radixin/moesin family domain-containing protein [Ditylenchus destructor]